MTLTLRLHQTDIRDIEKAMWMERLLSIIDDRVVTLDEVVVIAQAKCNILNIPCRSSWTIKKYLIELVKQGKLICEKRGFAHQCWRNFYSKPKGEIENA